MFKIGDKVQVRGVYSPVGRITYLFKDSNRAVVDFEDAEVTYYLYALCHCEEPFLKPWKGVEIEQSTIDKWVKESLIKAKKGGKNEWKGVSRIESGDTLVFATNNGKDVEVTVCKMVAKGHLDLDKI